LNCPKPSPRVVDQSAIEYVRNVRDRRCVYGFYCGDPCNSDILHVHHIKKRSQGGDDIPENLITLCPKHHTMAERHEISPETFIKILEEFKNYE